MSAAIQAAAGVPAGVRLRNELDLGRAGPLNWSGSPSASARSAGLDRVSGRFFKLLIDATVVVGPTGKSIGRLHCDYSRRGFRHIARIYQHPRPSGCLLFLRSNRPRRAFFQNAPPGFDW